MALDVPGSSEVVGEAADGREAIDAAAELRPDVMVLDESMPVLRGTEAIPRLREVAPEMRIVLYSAYALTDQRTRFDELADAVVAKGLDLRDLARLVANI
jgi:DNA-binding NarL/FixJ family response regulator